MAEQRPSGPGTATGTDIGLSGPLDERVLLGEVRRPPEPIRPRRVPLRKRLLDVVGAGGALVVLAPVLLVALFVVRTTSRGPVLFRQVRIGRSGMPFTMLKLRTMYVDCDGSAQREHNTRELLDPDFVPPTTDGSYKDAADPRVTPIGRVLRRYSIDELPQLVNVVRGDMSLVGPRPSLPWEVELYPGWARRRALVPPGVTGPWQVSGRNRLSMLEMLELDRRYVDDWSLRTDLRCLLHTPAAVVHGDGAS